MIKFFNIRTREVLVADSEPKIAALWSSSDHSPNITQGQDFGWRLAPEIVVEMKRIMGDQEKINSIAREFNISPEDVKEPDVLAHISKKYAESEAPVATAEDYSAEYQAEIRRLEEQDRQATIDTATTTTTESLEAMERRAELEERIAKAKREQLEADNAVQTSTTTTTAAPTTTTTTTKKH